MTRSSRVRDGGRWWLLGAAGLALLLLVANVPLVTGHARGIWDVADQFKPYYMLVGDFARAGQLVLWNPLSNGGSPDFAQPELGTLSPLTVLHAWTTGGTEAGFRAYWLGLWLLGGVGMLLLTRHLGAPLWGSLIASAGYMFSGPFIGHAEHTSHIHSLAWLPLLVWRLDAALVSRRWRPALEAGAIWGLSGLAGYPGLTILHGVFVFVWAMGRSCFRVDAGARRLGFALATVSLVCVVGLVVLSPTYLGFVVEGRGFSDRAGALDRDEAVENNALHPGALATVASPYLATLRFDDGSLWSYTDVSSISVYSGAIVIWLAGCALIADHRRRGWRWFLAILAALALGLAVGRVLPLRGWFFDLFPPSRFFRHPAIFRDYAVLVVAVLASLGAGTMTADSTTRRQRSWCTVWALAIGAGAVTAYYGVINDAPGPSTNRGLADAHLWMVWSGVCVLAICAQRGARGLGTLAVTLMIVDALLVSALSRTVSSADPALMARWDRVVQSRNPDATPDRIDWARQLTMGPTNDHLPDKTPVLSSYGPMGNRFHERIVEHPLLAGSAIGDDRVWFSPVAATVWPADATFDAFVARTEALAGIPLVVHPRAGLTDMPRPDTPGFADSTGVAAIRSQPGAIRIAASVETYRPTVLDLSVDCPDDGWLLVTERWAAGWTAEVNGQQVPVLGGNFVFRAVPVRAGPNRVRVTYRPFGHPWLLLLSWGTVGLLALRVRPPGERRARNRR